MKTIYSYRKTKLVVYNQEWYGGTLSFRKLAILHDNIHIGEIGVNYGIYDISLHWRIDEKYEGMGKCSFALQKLIKYLKENTDVNTLNVRISDKNTRSKNLALRNGFTEVGGTGIKEFTMTLR